MSELATPWQRLRAAVVDLLLFAVPQFMMLTGMRGRPALGFFGFFLGLAMVAYQSWLLTRSGATVGKRLLGIRVVCARTGGNPGFLRAVLLRSWLNALLCRFLPYLLVDCALIFRDDRRCIHDWIASTTVVQVPAESPPAADPGGAP